MKSSMLSFRPPERSRSEIRDVLRDVAEGFGSPGRETLLYEVLGTHADEIALLLNLLPSAAPRILDVGGGLGVNLLAMRRLLPDAELCLIDNFEEYTDSNPMGSHAEAARLHDEAGIRVVSQDFWRDGRLPFEDAVFDVVTNLAVIEHLPGHPLGLLREMRRVLHPGGVAMVSGPNAIALTKRVKLLLGVHPYIPFELWTGERYYSHYREYTAAEFRELLTRAGFIEPETRMSREPWRTMAAQRYRHGRRSLLSPYVWGMRGLDLIQAIVPSLRASIYCIARRPA